MRSAATQWAAGLAAAAVDHAVQGWGVGLRLATAVMITLAVYGLAAAVVPAVRRDLRGVAEVAQVGVRRNRAI